MNATLELPTLPVPRARALALLTDDNSKMNEIALVIEGDPGLTASVLRAANSAISAPRSRVRSASQAIVRIGLGATRRIVAGAVVGNAFEHLQRAAIDVDALWRHLIATALIADAAARTGQGSTDAFTSGLLHDLGRLAMAGQDPNRYARIVQLGRRGVPIAQAEYLMFGADHSTLGVRLGEAWRLPEEIIEAIGDHHRPDSGSALATAVYRARSIAWGLGMGDGVLPAPEPSLKPDSPDGAIVKELRGAKALMSRIEWYQDAIREG